MAAVNAPPLVKAARPTSRDRRPLSANLANLSPESLSSILRNAELGNMQQWADLCDRMVEMDAEIRADYETRCAAISGARWQIEPGHCGDPVRDAHAAEGAAFLETVIENCRDFDQASQDLLDGIGKGYSASQLDWTWDSGSFVVRGFEWIHQRRFKYASDFSLRLVDDGVSLSSEGEELNPDLWIVHAPRSVAGYPTRTGVMRACAWPYLFKRWCQQFWVQGAESFAWPFLWAKVPRGADAAVRAKALDGLEQLSADHRAVMEEGGAYELLETTVKDGGTWKQLSESLNAEIAKAILGMTDLSGPGKVGAYGAVKARHGATVIARIALDERQLAATFRDQFAERHMRFNAHRWGGVVPPTPMIRRIVTSSREPLPTDQLGAMRVNEIRSAAEQEPLAGPVGDQLWRDFIAGKDPNPVVVPVGGDVGAGSVSDAAPNGAQLDSLQKFLEAVGLGTLAPGAAKLLIGKTFGAFFSATDVATMVDEQAAKSPQAAAAGASQPAEPAAIKVEPGSRWVDTEDGNHLEVVSVADDGVRFLDLDGPNPTRQWRWSRASFLERARPDSASPTVAPAAA
jgi:hypothetical protein